MIEVVDPLHSIPVSYCRYYGAPLIIFLCLTTSLICQARSFALPALIGCTGIALLSQSDRTHRLQWTMLPSLRLEEPFSGQSHTLLT